jgi:hypothetical protein
MSIRRPAREPQPGPRRAGGPPGIAVLRRLQRYIGSRAKRPDVARRTGGRTLLQPLLSAIQKLRADAAARATRRASSAEEPPTPTQ